MFRAQTQSSFMFTLHEKRFNDSFTSQTKKINKSRFDPPQSDELKLGEEEALSDN